MQRSERQRARRSTVVGGAATTKGAIVWCKWRTQNSRTKVVGWGVGVRVYYYIRCLTGGECARGLGEVQGAHQPRWRRTLEAHTSCNGTEVKRLVGGQWR